VTDTPPCGDGRQCAPTDCPNVRSPSTSSGDEVTGPSKRRSSSRSRSMRWTGRGSSRTWRRCSPTTT
jgi:hypothetical protein